MDFITYAKSKKYTNQAVAVGGDPEETKEIIAEEVSKVVTTIQGPKGEPGKDGVTPNLTIGAVETLPSNSDATATITGDKENPVLNLGIPKGADGNNVESGTNTGVTLSDTFDPDGKYDLYVNNGKIKLFKHDYTIPKAFNDQTATSIMAYMEPGINIGNSLDSYDINKGFSEDGFLNQETCWMNPEITQEMIQKIKSLGFRSVRIPITWYHNTYINENGERKVGKYFKARIREVVDWALDAGLYVVINTHFDAAKGFLFKIGETEEDFATILKDVEDVWSDIAEKFKMYGDKLIFESFNEITTSNHAYGNIVTNEKNNQFTLLNQKFVDTVRATGYNNANRLLIIQSMYTKQTHDAAKRFVVPTDTATNKLAYAIHPYTYLIGVQNEDFFRKLNACKKATGLPMSFNEWGTFKNNIPTASWRVKQAQDFEVRCSGIGANSQWWDNGKEHEFKILDRVGSEDKEDMVNALLASRSQRKPLSYIRPSKVHDLTGYNVQKGTWQADGTLSYKSTWGSISSPMYNIEGNKYAQYSCVTMNEADEKIVVMAHIKYFDADGNLLPTTGSSAALSFPTLERLDVIPENAVKCCYTIYSKHNHLTYEQYRDLINSKDLVCRVALFNGEDDMEQTSGDVTTMNLKYTYWEVGNRFDEVNSNIILVEDENATALQMPRRCLGNTKYNITIADYVDTNNLSIEILESSCDNNIIQRHTLNSGTTTIITNENTSKMYFNIIGDGNFSTNLNDLYEKVSPISSFSDRTCTSFTLNSNDITLTSIGQKFEIIFSNNVPSDSVIEPIYAIGDDSIVSVNNNIITALKKGTTDIFVYVGNYYQKISITVDTSSSIIPIEFNDSFNYFTADGVWQTSMGETGVKGIRVEPNATYSITRNGSYSSWYVAESNELASGVTLSNIAELDRTKTEAEYTASSTAKYLLVSSANSKIKTLNIEKISGGTNMIVPQTGTWQLKETTNKKYITISTDDDNNGNASFFRLLRTYGFPYTMNIEAENVNKNIGTDDNGTFTNSDAESLFTNDITVKELGKYLTESGLGEVTQHGSSAYVLWDSNNLTGTFLDELYDSYTSQGGTKTKEELVAEIKLQLAVSDVSQGATYVEESKATIENAIGYPIYALQTWGGVPIATVDGIECNLNRIKGGEYDYRGHNYVFASPRVGMSYKASHSLYDKTRNYYTTDIQTEIDKIAIGDIEDFFSHMPYNDLGSEALRQMLDVIKANVDAGIVEVVTPTQYYNLGEWVDNPITSISISRNNISLGDSDTDSAYIITATYEDGTTADVSNEAIIDRNLVNTSEVGKYTVSATYRGFNSTLTVSVIDSSYTIPEGLKDTEYWFIAKNETQNKLMAANTTGTFGTVGKYSGLLKITQCSGGNCNGWISEDNGQTWTKVNENNTHYQTIVTDGTGTTNNASQLNFGCQGNDEITFLETSENFSIEI